MKINNERILATNRWERKKFTSDQHDISDQMARNSHGAVLYTKDRIILGGGWGGPKNIDLQDLWLLQFCNYFYNFFLFFMNFILIIFFMNFILFLFKFIEFFYIFDIF